jgi:two-component system, NarL family, response regulator DevR
VAASGSDERTAVLVVDDHELIREGMRNVLDAEPDMEVVGEARTADEALALARRLAPQVIVLDARLPDRRGIEICGELRTLSPTRAS